MKTKTLDEILTAYAHKSSIHEYELDGGFMTAPKDLCQLFGFKKAVVLQKIHWWILYNFEKNYRSWYKDGYWWTSWSQEEWIKQLPNFGSKKTFARTVKQLKDLGLIVTDTFNKGCDRTAWYRVDIKTLEKILQIGDRRDISLDLLNGKKPNLEPKQDKDLSPLPCGQNGTTKKTKCRLDPYIYTELKKNKREEDFSFEEGEKEVEVDTPQAEEFVEEEKYPGADLLYEEKDPEEQINPEQEEIVSPSCLKINKPLPKQEIPHEQECSAAAPPLPRPIFGKSRQEYTRDLARASQIPTVLDRPPYDFELKPGIPHEAFVRDVEKGFKLSSNEGLRAMAGTAALGFIYKFLREEDPEVKAFYYARTMKAYQDWINRTDKALETHLRIRNSGGTVELPEALQPVQHQANAQTVALKMQQLMQPILAATPAPEESEVSPKSEVAVIAKRKAMGLSFPAPNVKKKASNSLLEWMDSLSECDRVIAFSSLLEIPVAVEWVKTNATAYDLEVQDVDGTLSVVESSIIGF